MMTTRNKFGLFCFTDTKRNQIVLNVFWFPRGNLAGNVRKALSVSLEVF